MTVNYVLHLSKCGQELDVSKEHHSFAVFVMLEEGKGERVMALMKINCFMLPSESHLPCFNHCGCLCSFMNNNTGILDFRQTQRDK